MKRKYFWWILLIIILAGAIYGYMEYNRKRPDLQTVSPKFTISATDLLNEFTKNEAAANKKYHGLNVIIAVNGTIKATEKDEKGSYTVLLGDSASMSSVRCSMDSSYAHDTDKLRTGNTVTIKGYFNGFKPDDLGLGADVELNLCTFDGK